MKRIVLTAVLLPFLLLPAHATWSIIVIDARTHEIGIGGASCTYSVYGIGAIVPGKGAVVVQAMSNKDAQAKGVQLVKAGASPQDILKAMMDARYDPEHQQYAIITVNKAGDAATYTGKQTNGFNGTLTAPGVSVQGNTLSSAGELQEIMDAVIRAQQDSMNIEDVLMLALEAGAKYGGDKRCGETKAFSAFLTVAKPSDDISHPAINLIVNQTGDDVNAVIALRKKFTAWRESNK